jgi:hypothetical protein
MIENNHNTRNAMIENKQMLKITEKAPNNSATKSKKKKKYNQLAV